MSSRPKERSHPILTEIDLSKTTKHGGAGLKPGPTYLVMVDGQFEIGKFSKQWYGLDFDGGYGHQYDPPTENGCRWQRVWLFENAPKIAKEDERRYAKARREYAIKHGLTSNGQKITEKAPLEAFLYHPKEPAMPYDEDGDTYGDENEGWED